MAANFAPELGMDIGGSNYTGRGQVDYSGFAQAMSMFGSAFDSKSGSKPSENDLFAERIAPLVDSLGKVDQSNLSPRQKTVQKAKMTSSWLADPNNAPYASKAKSYLDLADETQQKQLSPLQQEVNDWSTKEDNQDRNAMFMLEAMDENGNIDENKYNKRVLQAIQDDGFISETDNLIKKSEGINKLNKAQGQAVWDGDQNQENSYMSIYNQVHKAAEGVFTPETWSKAMMLVAEQPGTINDAVFMGQIIIPLENEIDRRRALYSEVIDKRALALKIDISTEEYKAKREAALAGFDTKKSALTRVKNDITKVAEFTKTLYQALQTQEGMNTIQAKQALNTLLTKAFGPVIGNQILNNPELGTAFWQRFTQFTQEDIAIIARDIAQGKTNIGLELVNSTLPIDISKVGVAKTTIDQEGNPVAVPMGQQTPEEKAALVAMPKAQKVELSQKVYAILDNPTSATTNELPFASTLVGQFLDLSAQSDSGKLSNAQLKKLFSTGLNETAVRVSSELPPNFSAEFVGKMDNAIQQQLNLNWGDVKNQLSVIERAVAGVGPNEIAPKIFSFEIVNGKYTPVISEVALRNNPKLQKFISTNDIKTPDDLIKSFSNVTLWKSLLGKDVVDSTKLTDSINNINYLQGQVLAMPPMIQQAMQTSSAFNKNEKDTYNSRPDPTPLEASVNASVAEQGIPENLLQYKADFFEYFRLEDERTSLPKPSRSEVPDPRIGELGTQIDSVRTKIQPIISRSPKIMDMFRKAYDAEKVKGRVQAGGQGVAPTTGSTQTMTLQELMSQINSYTPEVQATPGQ